MELTVLGKYGPFPAANGSCSGYLLRQGNTKVLLDCGNGVLSRLQQYCGVTELDAIVLSHLHSDHMADMLVLRYALQILKKRGQFDGLMKVYLPKTPKYEFDVLSAAQVFDVTVLEDGVTAKFGDLHLKFFAMSHPVESYAVRAEYAGRVLCYSGDANSNERILDAAKDADLFLCDAGLLQADDSPSAPHLTAAKAARCAAQAGAKKLILTHIWPFYKPQDILDEAFSEFKNCELAAENTQMQV